MKPERLPWFKCYPTKLLGALAAMKPMEGYVYWIVCLRIYEVGGPCADTLDALTRRCGTTKRRVSDALDSLFKAGKLERKPEGISNPFAERVLDDSRTLSQKRSNATAGAVEQRAEIPQQNQNSEGLFDTRLIHQNGPDIDSRSNRRKNSSSRYSARHPMPEDWNPTEKGILYARERQFSDAKISVMVRACRDYHLKHGTLIAGEVGLAATWRTWCDNEVKFSKERSNGYRGSRTLQDDSLSVSGAAERLQTECRNGSVAFSPRPRLDAPARQNDQRLLPKG